jgi:hypothetical protein
MVTYLPRSAWGARDSRGGVALDPAVVVGEALHWPGMANPIDATGDIGFRRVASALRGWQNYHMDNRGWSDIAYQLAVDQAGRAWTLRGLNIRSGANGDATTNRLYGAFLLILAPGEKPSAAMIATTKGVILDFRQRFPKARLKPYGHKDVRAAGTDCPGPIAYAAINAGTFTPTLSTGGTMAFDNTEISQIRAAVQAELEEFAVRFWVSPTGTGTGLRGDIAEIQATQGDHTARLQRIEDDTDDTTA